MSIELDMTQTSPDYAMYTDIGNAAVHAVVKMARKNELTWEQTLQALRTLAEQKPFGEAMDTMVREYVFDALGFGAKGENFYV